MTAKGYDFSNSVNADLGGRPGVKWADATKAVYCQNRADYFTGRNVDNAVSTTSDASCLGTDQPGRKVW